MGKPIDALRATLGDMSLDKIRHELINDDLRKAFWINIYNANFQILRKLEQVTKPEIFTSKLISIAHTKWSLDDIEHGILRRFRFKYSLGFLPDLFVPPKIKILAVAKIDYRIHFALNCGAVSCPPIAFYSPEKIELQLDMTSLSFLERETDYLPDKKEVHISKLFLWFLGDFGGKKGVRNILKSKLNLNTVGYRLIYKDYSWEEKLDYYKDFTNP